MCFQSFTNCETLKTRVKLNLNFTRPHAITYTNRDQRELEAVMNRELKKIFYYCVLNKLSVNMNKTNFMLITSSKKKRINIKIHNIEHAEKLY